MVLCAAWIHIVTHIDVLPLSKSSCLRGHAITDNSMYGDTMILHNGK